MEQRKVRSSVRRTFNLYISVIILYYIFYANIYVMVSEWYNLSWSLQIIQSNVSPHPVFPHYLSMKGICWSPINSFPYGGQTVLTHSSQRRYSSIMQTMWTRTEQQRIPHSRTWQYHRLLRNIVKLLSSTLQLIDRN